MRNQDIARPQFDAAARKQNAQIRHLRALATSKINEEACEQRGHLRIVLGHYSLLDTCDVEQAPDADPPSFDPCRSPPPTYREAPAAKEDRPSESNSPPKPPVDFSVEIEEVSDDSAPSSDDDEWDWDSSEESSPSDERRFDGESHGDHALPAYVCNKPEDVTNNHWTELRDHVVVIEAEELSMGY